MHSINPTAGKLIRRYPATTTAAVEQALQRASAAFGAWKRTPFEERTRLLNATAAILRKRADELARLMALEMGKPVAQGRAEIEKCAWACEFMAANAAGFLQREPVATDAAESFVTFQPLGVVLAVMPWNFPFWQVFRCATAILMAGNVMVLKHAANVSGCALAIAKMFRAAEWPDGVFQTLLVESERVAALIEHPHIAAVTVTGSVAAGRAVAAVAGRCLKKVVLELGGSDPYVILEDAALAEAAAACAASRLINAGQSCIAAKRFIVVESVRREFEKLFVQRMRAQTVGDPLAAAVTVGPLARRDLRTGLHRQVQRSLAQGAKLLLGGKIPRRTGWFYPPTVLTNVRPGMPAFEEETFGPVAAIVSAADEAAAIALANRSQFGLGAAVFTADRARGTRIAADELEAGNCFVNAFVKSDPRLPFGGIKNSGFGRELGLLGIREFVNAKSVYVK